MISAYVMIKSELGVQNDVFTKVLKINGVKKAHTIVGPWDLIAFVESEDINTLGKTVISRIQNLKGIRDTMTCIVVEPI